METDAVTKKEFLKWLNITITIQLAFILLLILDLAGAPYAFAIIPFILLDVKIILTSSISLASHQEFYQKENLKDIIEGIGSLMFKVLQLAYWLSKSFNFFYSLIPLISVLILRCCYRTVPASECHSFSTLLGFWGRWTRLWFYVSIGCKIEGYADISWVESLWLVWVLLCFLALICLGLLILFLTTILSAFSDEATRDEVISTGWMTFNAVVWFLSLGYFFVSVANQASLLLSLVIVICCLSLTHLSTFVLLNRLVKWWSVFFIPDNTIVPEDERTERPLVSPSQSWLSRIRSALKTPPKALVRLSSTYYQPAEVEPTPGHKKAMSGKEQNTVSEEEDMNTTHRRINSTTVKLPDSPKEVKNLESKICSMCCEKESNAVIMECGHGGVCYECSMKMWKRLGHCHMCREPICQILQVRPSITSDSFKVISTTRPVFRDNN